MKAAVWSVQVLTQEKAAIKIQAGVRGLLTRLQVHRTAQEELQFIGMKPKVVSHVISCVAAWHEADTTAHILQMLLHGMSNHVFVCGTSCKPKFGYGCTDVRHVIGSADDNQHVLYFGCWALLPPKSICMACQICVT